MSVAARYVKSLGESIIGRLCFSMARAAARGLGWLHKGGILFGRWGWPTKGRSEGVERDRWCVKLLFFASRFATAVSSRSPGHNARTPSSHLIDFYAIFSHYAEHSRSWLVFMFWARAFLPFAFGESLPRNKSDLLDVGPSYSGGVERTSVNEESERRTVLARGCENWWKMGLNMRVEVGTSFCGSCGGWLWEVRFFIVFGWWYGRKVRFCDDCFDLTKF